MADNLRRHEKGRAQPGDQCKGLSVQQLRGGVIIPADSHPERAACSWHLPHARQRRGSGKLSHLILIML